MVLMSHGSQLVNVFYVIDIVNFIFALFFFTLFTHERLTIIIVNCNCLLNHSCVCPCI